MNNVISLSHTTKRECKYHIFLIPKCRWKVLFGQFWTHLHEDHVHVLISIPLKSAVARVIGYIKGKNAIHIARSFLGQKKNYGG